MTKVKFEIPSGFPPGERGNDKVVLKVYDILGKEIAILINEQLQPGRYEVTFDGSNLPSGVYFYQLRAGDIEGSGQLYSETRRMLLIK